MDIKTRTRRLLKCGEYLHADLGDRWPDFFYLKKYTVQIRARLTRICISNQSDEK